MWPVAAPWHLSPFENVRSEPDSAVEYLQLRAFSPAARAVATALQVWDATTLTCLATLTGHQGPVRTLVRCGDKVFSGSYDKTVRVWDVVSGRAVGESLVGHSGRVTSVAMEF